MKKLRLMVLGLLLGIPCAALAFDYEKSYAEYDSVTTLSACNKVFNETLKVAEQNDPAAQDLVGVMLSQKKCRLESSIPASEWFSRASELGSPSAPYHQGVKFEYGLGVRQDYQSAAELYKKSASRGYASAYLSLGKMYTNGALPKDCNEAFELFKKAAYLGDSSSQRNLSEVYLNGSESRECDRSSRYDRIQAYKWAFLSIKNTPANKKKVPKLSYGPLPNEDYIKLLAKKLSPEEISSTEKAALECKSRNYTSCD